MTEVTVLKEMLNKRSQFGKFVDMPKIGAYNERVQGYGDLYQIFFDPKQFKICINDKLFFSMGQEVVLEKVNMYNAEYKFYPRWNNKHCLQFKFNANTEPAAEYDAVMFTEWFVENFDKMLAEKKAELEAEEKKKSEENKSENAVEKTDAPKKKRAPRSKKPKTAEPETAETDTAEPKKRAPRKRTKSKANDVKEKTA